MRTGLLRSRIGPTLGKGGLRVDIGPIRLSKNEKRFPFYGRFQELGWKATGRANRRTAKNPRQIPGKHFLKKAGEQSFRTSEKIFASRVFQGLREIQSAGEAAGIL